MIDTSSPGVPVKFTIARDGATLYAQPAAAQSAVPLEVRHRINSKEPSDPEQFGKRRIDAKCPCSTDILSVFLSKRNG